MSLLAFVDGARSAVGEAVKASPLNCRVLVTDAMEE